ncbi:MAG: PAS domain-containing protein [Novosphingobium sp.]|nr:PAS domain-containing protein [Novosphingobium sp.]
MPQTQLPGSLSEYFENSAIALSMAEGGEDQPLLVVNRPFRELTGYPGSEIIGKNCRFLQGDTRSANEQAREAIHQFLRHDRIPNVRTQILNFRKDGKPFINLLYMSKLRSLSGEVRYIFASQFDISRARPELLEEYDDNLEGELSRLSPVLAEAGIIVEGTLTTIANSAAAIAQAKLTLSDLDGKEPL